MSWTEFLTNLRRYEQNAAVIFDAEEPIGRPTDLVMPRRRWFRRDESSKNSAPLPAARGEKAS